MLLDDTLDLALDHDLPALARWLGEAAADAPPWRLLAIDDAEDPMVVFRLVRRALRLDPDGLVLGLRHPFGPELPELLALVVQTGHAVFVRGTTPERLAVLEAGLAAHDVAGEAGAAFLAGLPARSFAAELTYVDLAQAPRPVDLEEGFDRYQTTSAVMPASAPPPAAAGEVLPLRVEDVEPLAFEPAGVAAVGVLPGATPLVRGPLPAEARPLIAATTARVHDVSRHELDEEDGPGQVVHRLYLDVPTWVGALLPAGDAGYLDLTHHGRRPVVRFR